MVQNKTVTANFPGIGNVQISIERAKQIKRLQKIILDQRAQVEKNLKP